MNKIYINIYIYIYIYVYIYIYIHVYIYVIQIYVIHIIYHITRVLNNLYIRAYILTLKKCCLCNKIFNFGKI